MRIKFEGKPIRGTISLNGKTFYFEFTTDENGELDWVMVEGSKVKREELYALVALARRMRWIE